MWLKITAGLLSLLTAAFMAWAGVIWSAWQDVSDTLFDIHAGMQVAVVEIENIKKDLHKHETRPWHDQAGQAHSQSRREIDVIRERLDNIEKHNDH